MGSVSVVLVFVLLWILVIVALRNLSLSVSKKIAIGSVLSICLVIMGIYNYQQSHSENITAFLEDSFNNGQTLNCEGFLVNQSDFNLVSQTYTLIGKTDTPVSNIIISLNKCKVVEPSNEDKTINGHTIDELLRD